MAIGDSWISPIDFVLAWPSMLLATSLIDQEDMLKVSNAALNCQGALMSGNSSGATDAWGKTEEVILQVTDKCVLSFALLLTSHDAEQGT